MMNNIYLMLSSPDCCALLADKKYGKPLTILNMPWRVKPHKTLVFFSS